MSADVIQIRTRATDTFVCPCGSQWFTRAHRFDVDGHCIESRNYMQCEDCDRKHKTRPNPKP